MTAITIGPSRSYIRNVHAAAHELIVALLALDSKRPAVNSGAGNKRRSSGGASMHQAYADVLAAQTVPREAAPRRHAGRGVSHALLPYHLWSARAERD